MTMQNTGDTYRFDLPSERECLCWVGHGGCGGCSGYPGITHEPACGWEWNPDCRVHASTERPVIGSQQEMI